VGEPVIKELHVKEPVIKEPVIKELVVTGPLRGRLFDLFTHLYAGRSDVRVILDRRHAERRCESQPEAPQRRRAERRRRSPAWVFPPPD
jgi:hypothetical protein